MTPHENAPFIRHLKKPSIPFFVSDCHGLYRRWAELGQIFSSILSGHVLTVDGIGEADKEKGEVVESEQV